MERYEYGKCILMHLPFLLKNTCVIINIIVFFTTFAAVFVKEANKNLIFILLWNVPRATALLCDI